MAVNEIFPPNGPHNKMSLPVADKADTGSNLYKAVAGRVVKVGDLIGVLQTDKEAKDGDATGVINSNAPGNCTVWNSGTWHLDSNVAAPSGGADVGSVVYGKEQAGTDVLVPVVGTPGSSNGGSGDYYPIGTLYVAAKASDKRFAVRLNETAGEAETVA